MKIYSFSSLREMKYYLSESGYPELKDVQEIFVCASNGYSALARLIEGIALITKPPHPSFLFPSFLFLRFLRPFVVHSLFSSSDTKRQINLKTETCRICCSNYTQQPLFKPKSTTPQPKLLKSNSESATHLQ
ncbi:MAG: hypothetical protein RLZZ507_4609 [Cyanobacteriota bacterium]